MGRRPPSGFGSKTMRTNLRTFDHWPSCSNISNKSHNLCSNSSESRAYALGATLSPPSPVPMGKEFAAARISRGVSFGGLGVPVGSMRHV
eukprot:5321083-Karenia_brevis.AAC.1